MSTTTIKAIKVNFPKFREVRGDKSLVEHAETIGLTPDMWYKIERGDRWKHLQKFADLCVKMNKEPNEFFEIVKQIS
jgi:hypothetical protein